MINNKIFTVLVILVSVILFCWVYKAESDTITWDYPGDNEWNALVGYNIHYSNPDGIQFVKNVLKDELTSNSTTVLYKEINNKLHLQYNQEYTFWVTAYDIGQESEDSNTCIYIRDGYSVPDDILPPMVITITGPVTITIE